MNHGEGMESSYTVKIRFPQLPRAKEQWRFIMVPIYLMLLNVYFKMNSMVSFVKNVFQVCENLVTLTQSELGTTQGLWQGSGLGKMLNVEDTVTKNSLLGHFPLTKPPSLVLLGFLSPLAGPADVQSTTQGHTVVSIFLDDRLQLANSLCAQKPRLFRILLQSSCFPS